MHAEAVHESSIVMEAYNIAAGFAEESGNFKHQVGKITSFILVVVFSTAVDYLRYVI